MSDHVVSPKLYFAIFLALLVLTGLTVYVSGLDLGRWNTPVALGIAVGKALLVILFFMHVKYSSRLTWVFAAGAFFWLFLMLAGTISDYVSRGWLGTPGS